MGVLTAAHETVARRSSTICSGILRTFLGWGALNVEMLSSSICVQYVWACTRINWCWWIWKAFCECDSAETQTADWRLKISPIDASPFKSPSCVNWLKSSNGLKEVEARLYVCVVKARATTRPNNAKCFGCFVLLRVELHYKTEVVMLTLYLWIFILWQLLAPCN